MDVHSPDRHLSPTPLQIAVLVRLVDGAKQQEGDTRHRCDCRVGAILAQCFAFLPATEMYDPRRERKGNAAPNSEFACWAFEPPARSCMSPKLRQPPPHSYISLPVDALESRDVGACCSLELRSASDGFLVAVAEECDYACPEGHARTLLSCAPELSDDFSRSEADVANGGADDEDRSVRSQQLRVRRPSQVTLRDYVSWVGLAARSKTIDRSAVATLLHALQCAVLRDTACSHGKESASSSRSRPNAAPAGFAFRVILCRRLLPCDVELVRNCASLRWTLAAAAPVLEPATSPLARREGVTPEDGAPLAAVAAVVALSLPHRAVLLDAIRFHQVDVAVLLVRWLFRTHFLLRDWSRSGAMASSDSSGNREERRRRDGAAPPSHHFCPLGDPTCVERQFRSTSHPPDFCDLLAAQLGLPRSSWKHRSFCRCLLEVLLETSDRRESLFHVMVREGTYEVVSAILEELEAERLRILQLVLVYRLETVVPTSGAEWQTWYPDVVTNVVEVLLNRISALADAHCAVARLMERTDASGMTLMHALAMSVRTVGSTLEGAQHDDNSNADIGRRFTLAEAAAGSSAARAVEAVFRLLRFVRVGGGGRETVRGVLDGSNPAQARRGVFRECPLLVGMDEEASPSLSFAFSVSVSTPVHESAPDELPLHCAARVGNLALVVSLLDLAEDYLREQQVPQPERTSSSAPDRLRDGRTDPMRTAVDAGRWAAVVECRNAVGATPLWLAASNGYFEVCACLLRRGARSNTSTSAGVSALEVAVKRGHYQTVECLVAHGAEVTQFVCMLAARFDDERVDSIRSPRTARVRSEARTSTGFRRANNSGDREEVASSLVQQRSMLTLLQKHRAQLTDEEEERSTAVREWYLFLLAWIALAYAILRNVSWWPLT